ncbi:MAG: hypothetical protein JNK65_00215, partial [Deltaproteobacteria bacterium]|nr:hypothetical protein [Deltaproteobacteria bacterium]
EEIESALQTGNRELTEAKVQQFLAYACAAFRVPSVKVEVLEKRPSNHRGELHGLYQANPKAQLFKITLWMRTAKRIQIVAFRTFLRTLLHELLHHLDYQYLKLSDSFHTEGFYKRESSLLFQLLPTDGSHA